jgi:hypothetical protein
VGELNRDAIDKDVVVKDDTMVVIKKTKRTTKWTRPLNKK